MWEQRQRWDLSVVVQQFVLYYQFLYDDQSGYAYCHQAIVFVPFKYVTKFEALDLFIPVVDG